MLEDFTRRHDIDILFVQEVTNTEVTAIRGYESHYNIGTSMRGTALVKRTEINITITNLPLGRAIAAYYRGACLINVLALSGTARRQSESNFLTMNYHIY
jgi:exonuclease III